MEVQDHTVTTREYAYTVVFEPAEEGGYTVTCPALPGLVTEGDTLVEARTLVAEAIRCYLESLQKDGLPISAEGSETSQALRERISVQVVDA